MLQTLGSVFGICILAYGYFVGVSIMNVIAQKEAMTESERIGRAVSMLEQEYFEISKSVTPELGSQLGLAPAQNTSFVRRPGAVGVAATQNTGI